LHRGFTRSIFLYNEASKMIPGGVNSPVRAFKSVGLNPVFIKKGEGAKIYDEDGNEYIDYVGSWGPLIVGHRHPRVIEALQKCLKNTGTSFGAPTELETVLASMVIEAVPSIDMLRLVNSGTEATMSALRLARAYTGRNKIVKFAGCYHGHADSLLIKAGSGALTLGVPTSPGVPGETAVNTIAADYNNVEKIEEIFKEIGEDIAAVIVEPVAGNMGVVPADPEFLTALREVTKSYNSLLIFDEVMTGFRVSYGGAQELYGVIPDLTCLGKIIGGGLPIGAYGGKKEIMEYVSPAGPVYQAGTLSGNPLAVTAGIATLEILKQKGLYTNLDLKTLVLSNELAKSAAKAGIELTVNRVGSMFSAFFTGEKVKDYATACTSNIALFKSFFQAMLNNGIYIAPSQYEAAFVSTAHQDVDIEQTLTAINKSMQSIN